MRNDLSRKFSHDLPEYLKEFSVVLVYFSWFRFKSQFVIIDDDETMDPVSMAITNPNYRMDIISLTLATGVLNKIFFHLYETYCFHFKLFQRTTNAVRWKR